MSKILSFLSTLKNGIAKIGYNFRITLKRKLILPRLPPRISETATREKINKSLLPRSMASSEEVEQIVRRVPQSDETLRMYKQTKRKIEITTRFQKTNLASEFKFKARAISSQTLG
jgi:hypothetical protein